MEAGVRIDKWLWCIRVFKTRNLATQSCRSGKVRIGDQPVKPSREVKPGEIITINLDTWKKSVKVLEVIENRVSAKFVEKYAEEMTPQEEFEKLKMRKDGTFGYRNRGLGRPTKKERRENEILKKYLGA